MAKRMLIDSTHSEETRVVVSSGSRLDEFDFETSTKKQIKGNIYLAKITRVEPSLQAAFVDYGGNRPPDRFRPQERTPEPEPGEATESERPEMESSVPLEPSHEEEPAAEETA